MSAIIRLSSKLPADEETNGLDSLRDQLVEDDSQVIVAMTWMKVAYTKKYPTGDLVPTVEIHRIEPVGTVESTPAAVQAMAAELYERRTGKTPLPFYAVGPVGQVLDVEVEDE